MSYAGDVTPQEAFRLLGENADTVLVDVRSPAELAYVGMADLGQLGKPVVTVQWYPELTGAELAQGLVAAGVNEGHQLLFICRSGVRSQHAATLATRVGYARSHNVVHGFEGDLDASGHRGTVNGWKVDGLPWMQT